MVGYLYNKTEEEEYESLHVQTKQICEGVETEEQNTLVSRSDCDYIQGWYYSKALPETLAEDFYKEYMKKF